MVMIFQFYLWDSDIHYESVGTFGPQAVLGVIDRRSLIGAAVAPG